MGWSESELGVCRKHPNQNQSQGVCPFCLRERLAHLCAKFHKKSSMVAPSCSSSSSLRSGSESKCGSPVRRGHLRNVSDVLGSVSFMVSVGNGLKKSRSIAFAPRNLDGEIGNEKKKKGFWSKLLHLKGRKEIFVH